MVNKAYYVLASFVAASVSGCCMYYCMCNNNKDKEEVTTIMDDIPQEDEPIPSQPLHNNGDDKEEDGSDEEEGCDCYFCNTFSDNQISCNEPLRVSKELLAVIGPKNSDECIYNICELVTLLNAYLSKLNWMTHQVVTINYPLAQLIDFQNYDTINYTLLLSTLLERHTSKF